MWLYVCLIFIGYFIGYLVASMFSVSAETDRQMDIYQHGYDTVFEAGRASQKETEN